MSKKKLFNMDEYDQATLKSFQDGFFQGMMQAHGLASASVQSLIVSIDDVVNLYDNKYDADQSLELVTAALKKVLKEMDTNYLDGVRGMKVEFGLEDDSWEDLTID